MFGSKSNRGCRKHSRRLNPLQRSRATYHNNRFGGERERGGVGANQGTNDTLTTVEDQVQNRGSE